MVRAGLGPSWRCAFANDIDPMKARAYARNWGEDGLEVGDVHALSPTDLPGRADLAWASFPCQDLSLAGLRGGLDAKRSSAFFGFHRLMAELALEDRAPTLIAIENVVGLASSNKGADFTALCAALAEIGYRVGALEIDAAHFLPQSRPRLFVIALHERASAPRALTGAQAAGAFVSPRVQAAKARLPRDLAERWIDWRLPTPGKRNANLIDILDWDAPCSSDAERFITLMAPSHRARLQRAIDSGRRQAGALFRRMRDEGGRRVQRAEVRFDGLCGCLRTPAGGSSRQFAVLVDGDAVRIRPMTGREAARAMGLDDGYRLPARESAALHLAGDGVAVPVIAFVNTHVFEPLLEAGLPLTRTG